MSDRKKSLLAATVVLEGEDPLLFRSLLRGFMNRFHPRDAVEVALVETMAVARWRQIRVWAMEKAGLDYQIGKQDEPVNPPTRAALAFRTLCDESRSLELMNRCETRFDRQFTRALKSLQTLQSEQTPHA